MHTLCSFVPAILVIFLSANALPVSDVMSASISTKTSGIERRAVVDNFIRCPVTSARISFFGIEAKGTRNQIGGRIFSSYFDGFVWSNTVLGKIRPSYNIRTKQDFFHNSDMLT